MTLMPIPNSVTLTAIGTEQTEQTDFHNILRSIYGLQKLSYWAIVILSDRHCIRYMLHALTSSASDVSSLFRRTNAWKSSSFLWPLFLLDLSACSLGSKVKFWVGVVEYFSNIVNLWLWLCFPEGTCCTGWGGHLFRRFRNTFSESSPCLLGQHGSCSTAQQPGTSQKFFYKIFRNKWPTHLV